MGAKRAIGPAVQVKTRKWTTKITCRRDILRLLEILMYDVVVACNELAVKERNPV